jgi:hypothetical protein
MAKSIKNTELSTARRDVLVAQAEERWLYSDNLLHRAAYALDPEHQKHDWHTDTFVTEALEDCLERCYGDDAEALASIGRKIEQYRNREGRFSRSTCVQNMELMSSWSWWAKYRGSIIIRVATVRHGCVTTCGWCMQLQTRTELVCI